MQELVGAGPDEVHDVVKRILVEAASSDAAAASSTQALQGAQRTGEGLHNLAPLGARVPVDAAAVQRTGGTLFANTSQGRPSEQLC